MGGLKDERIIDLQNKESQKLDNFSYFHGVIRNKQYKCFIDKQKMKKLRKNSLRAI